MDRGRGRKKGTDRIVEFLINGTLGSIWISKLGSLSGTPDLLWIPDPYQPSRTVGTDEGRDLPTPASRGLPPGRAPSIPSIGWRPAFQTLSAVRSCSSAPVIRSLGPRFLGSGWGAGPLPAHASPHRLWTPSARTGCRRRGRNLHRALVLGSGLGDLRPLRFPIQGRSCPGPLVA